MTSKATKEFDEIIERIGRGPLTAAEVARASTMTVEQFNAEFVRTPGTPAPALKDRPKCPGCNKPLKPVMQRQWPPQETNGLESQKWSGRYKSYGSFCTLSCCAFYANEMFRMHGTTFKVIKRKEGQ